jgi:hypothetical protein
MLADHEAAAALHAPPYGCAADSAVAAGYDLAGEFSGQDIDGLDPLQYEAQRGLLMYSTYVVRWSVGVWF